MLIAFLNSAALAATLAVTPASEAQSGVFSVLQSDDLLDSAINQVQEKNSREIESENEHYDMNVTNCLGTGETKMEISTEDIVESVKEESCVPIHTLDRADVENSTSKCSGTQEKNCRTTESDSENDRLSENDISAYDSDCQGIDESDVERNDEDLTKIAAIQHCENFASLNRSKVSGTMQENIKVLEDAIELMQQSNCFRNNTGI